jgi:hypothetical protein
VLNRRRQIADVLKPEIWLRSRAGQLLSGLGLAVSPQLADAARKGERRADSQERKHDDAGNDGDDRDQKNQQQEQNSDQKSDDKAGTEDRDSGAKSEKRDRNESRSENDESREQAESDNGKSRGESRRRDDDSDSSSREASSEDDDSSQGGGRRVREFEQQADEPAENIPAPTTVTPANPNVVIDDVPTTSIADLVVEANEDVIATVSTSGGFAFARSGDVIAVTGPDGATIIQTGDVTTGTNGTDPVEPPADGGNNDLDFAS